MYDMKPDSFKNLIDDTLGTVNSIEAPSITDFDNPIRDIKETYNSFRLGGESLIKEGDTLKIGVVGQVKAGKSSFLNSLFFDGENILPKASTPMTAGLTLLEYSDRNEFEVEYYTESEWTEFLNQDKEYTRIEKDVREDKENEGAPESLLQKEIKSRTSEVMQSAHELVTRCGRMAKSKIGKSSETVTFSSLRDLQSTLNQYVGADGEYTSVVKMLTLHLNDPRLKGVRIVDTPGVNDPIVSRENRTKEFLHSCHGVFFLSYSSRFFDSVDVNFMNSRIGNQGVGTVLMLASKYDDVLQDQGNRFQDDLEGADDSSRNSLEKRFDTQRKELIHQNVDIRFDTTSGISYALANKPSDKWDDIERHVDKRMHTLFPSAFSTPEDARETYLLLANFDQIRDEYLEKMFKANKDKIIQRKISEYFDNNISVITESVTELIDTAEERRKQLDDTDLKKLYDQEVEQNKLFTVLKGDFTSFISIFQNSLQASKDRIDESLRRPSIHMLPMEDIIVRVTYKGRMWGYNSDSFYVKAIDSQTLKEQLIESVNNYCDQWRNEWRSHFEREKDKMFNAFCEAITSFSQSYSDVNFSDKYYRQLMTQLLAEIDRLGVLKLQSIQTEYCDYFATQCDSQSISITDQRFECKKSEVQGRLDRKAREIVEPFQRIINNKLNSFAVTVSNAVENCLKPIIKSLGNLKSEVDTRLKTAGKEYIDNLKIQIQNKEISLKDIDNLIMTLKQLSEKIDSNK